MDASHEVLTRIFRALGDQTRLRLVTELAHRGELTCGEFAALCACSSSALSYHQRILCDAGVIAVRRAGQYRMLTLQREMLEGALPGFLDHLVGATPVATQELYAEEQMPRGEPLCPFTSREPAAKTLPVRSRPTMLALSGRRHTTEGENNNEQ